MRRLVSIVTPAYNAEKRVSETMVAIIDQDYDPLEIIFVDDGSTDATAALALEKLQSGRHKFEIIHLEENRGISAARNAGLRAASGDYVVFLDADDMADSNFISVLHEAVAKGDSDLAFCGYRYRSEGTGKSGTVEIDLDSAKDYSGADITLTYILKKISPAIWTTIFKKSFLLETGLEFTVGCRFGEDVEFLTKAFSRAGKITFVKQCPYLYVIHSGMMTRASETSKEKRLRRNIDSAGALIRAAYYLGEHSSSPKVRDIAECLLLPEGLIKALNASAEQRDAAKFFQTLNAPETRRALMSSRKYFTNKPEIFAKSVCLMIAPHIYFRRRAKS